jgi:methionyl-tRNA formyltransferase
MKIIFFGTPEFAIPALKALLIDKYDIVAVVTGPDRPRGRYKKIGPSPVKILAGEKKIKVFQPKSPSKDDIFFEEFNDLKPDLCIVSAYGKIIPNKMLNIPKFGFINIHPSLLPKYRGPSPIQTAILNGDKKTGVSIMKIDEKIDHGPVLAQRAPANGTSQLEFRKLHDELAKLGAELLINTLPKYIRGEITPREQDHDNATFTKLLTREDGKIYWSDRYSKIYNQIRALNPDPGTWTQWNNKVVNIKEAELVDGKLKIKTLQMEGKKEMSLESFLNGHPDFDIYKLK